jgi:hypothetical protein
MATAPPASPKVNSKPQEPGLRVPPEEQFWQRYSPHQEMPLSGLASFALHLLVIGMLVFLAWMGWLGFKKDNRSVPVEPVRFSSGGGGGKKIGDGNGPGVGEGALEASDSKGETPNPDPLKRPALNADAITAAPPAYQNNADFKRYIQEGNPNAGVFARVAIASKLADGLNPGRGQGGAGKDGGKGNGVGTGEGDGVGDGKSGKLNQREKRMLRWSMIFDTRSGGDYRTQLQALGAVIAVPVGNDRKNYKVIRDLSGRGKLLDEDITKINCIFWVDDRAESVRSLMGALGINSMPDHFIAFMPLKLEDELFRKERAYKGLEEDQIFETHFRVHRAGSGYTADVCYQKPK